MDCNSSCTLVLCGKSMAENEIAKSLKSNNSLKLPGDSGEVLTLLYSETERLVKEESFGFESFMNSLSATRFGCFLIWSRRLPSTHDIVSHNFCELPIGAACVSDVQFKGRGRSRNLWESPVGCLMFSFTLQMEDGRIVPLLQYVVSLAMTEAIKDVCYTNGLPHLDVKIKWPNDLYINGLKVGGILCTSTYKSMKFNVSAGIGLNVDNEKPTTCLNAAMQELVDAAYKFRREDIIAAFFNKFENFFDIFINQGFQALEELYYKTWLHSGQRVIIQEKNEENVVTIQGLTSSGYLLAMGEDSQMYELHPDGNRGQFGWGFRKALLTKKKKKGVLSGKFGRLAKTLKADISDFEELIWIVKALLEKVKLRSFSELLSQIGPKCHSTCLEPQSHLLISLFIASYLVSFAFYGSTKYI